MPVQATGVVNQKRSRDMGQASRVIRRKKCKRRRTVVALTPPPPQSSRPEVPMLLQKLYLACRSVFKGPGTIPCPSDVQLLCRILDNMKPEDVGLSSKTQSLISENVGEGRPRVTSSTIYHCENFSLCMFFLPATAVIPLHNHPGMTVFSKLLLGKLHIKAYDWVDPSSLDCSTPVSKPRLARLKVDSVFTPPCDTSVLYPTWGGNIHAVRAETPCAFLDVLGPPYSKEDGRDCSYYKDLPYTAFPNGIMEVVEEEANYRWLEEIEMPEESEMDCIRYLGPQIIEASC
ncbi:Cysteine oxygenase/2-aminoethanethiol dioxygenase [Dillenia turbinata]|uniref:cysteine dioxygenase n=1 Tax=Dillenia turbinata TaxID=194707 RepID=A0AAN8W0L2_9MAGN